MINSPSFHSQPNSWLQRQALLHPNHFALYLKDCQLTFSELNHYVQEYAFFYQEQLKKHKNFHQRIAILSNNHQKMYFSILALWELGIEVQLLNTRLTKDELIYQLEDAHTQLMITDLYKKTEISKATLLSFPKTEDLHKRSDAPFIDLGYQEKQIASIMYTSGTTGKPKGVAQTFKNHQASSLATQKSMKIQTGESWLCCLPLYHISGLSILLRSLVLGIGVHLCETFEPKEVNQLILRKNVNYLSLVTKMLRELMTYIPTYGYPKQFKQILLGGGPAERSLLGACEKINLSVMLSYGMTETCAQVVACQTKRSVQKGAAGKPLEHVQLRIKGTNHPFGAGEILLKGPSIVDHYLNNQGNTCWSDDGWFSTGDWGYLDKEGDLFILSRMSERIISGGENIYPAEIEAALLKNKKVAEAIVVGKKDDVWGQRPVAYVKLKKRSTVAYTELKQFLQVLAPYKHPDEIFVVHDLPKTASGKTLKRLFLTEERVNYIDYQLK